MLTCQIFMSDNYVDLSDLYVKWLYWLVRSLCQIIMLTCQIFMSDIYVVLSLIHWIIKLKDVFLSSYTTQITTNLFDKSTFHLTNNEKIWQVDISVWQVEIIFDKSRWMSNKKTLYYILCQLIRSLCLLVKQLCRQVDDILGHTLYNTIPVYKQHLVLILFPQTS